MKCKHGEHEYCWGRRCRYSEPVGGGGVCTLDWKDNDDWEQTYDLNKSDSD